MTAEGHLAEARNLYRKAVEEFERAKREKEPLLLRDTCSKGWLAAIEAANAIFLKKGVKDEELPGTDRGRRYMVYKYLERELRFIYFSLRESLHIEGYYNGSLGFEETKSHLEDLDLFIQKAEEL